MSTIVFLDTETTSLRPDRRAWEIGVIVRRPGEADTEHRWFVNSRDLDLGNADPFSLNVGGYYDRHPMAGYHPAPHAPTFDEQPRGAPCELDVLAEVEALIRGAHVIGAVPSFDDRVLDTRMRANGIAPSWHYHLMDVENLAVGWLAGRNEVPRADLLPPWDSESLSLAIGVEPASGEERHTALGDARWARRIWDTVMGGAA